MAPINHEFKLGDQIKALAVWNPQTSNLHYIRPASEEEIISNRLSFSRISNHESNLLKAEEFLKCKQRFISYLQSHCNKNFSHFLLYSLISPEPMFLDGPNIADLIS